MAGAGDIVGLSIPFTAGVAAAALVPAGPVRFQAAVCAVAVAAALLTALLRRGNSSVPAMALFFCLGFTSLLCSEMAGGGGITATPGPAQKALERLCAIIDSISFQDARTGALVKALLTGRREGLDSGTVNLFRTAGAAHILALSGLHLGVIYGILAKALAILGNSRAGAAARGAVSIGAAAFYMMMTGAAPSIVRAFLFITLNETLRQFPGRRRDPLRILCTALLIQLAISPGSIRSTGFQLSYLAMLGIFTVYQRLERWYPDSFGFDIPRKIWKSLVLSLSCQIFTAPLVWRKFRTFPQYFLITNLLALPLTELLMVSSVICVAGAGAGWCPDIMKSPVEILARTLIFCLETISTM